MENQSRSKVNRTSRITRRVRRGQLDKAYYPPIFWAVIGLVCVFGFYHGYQKLQHNTAVKRADAIQSKLEIDMVSKPKVRAKKKTLEKMRAALVSARLSQGSYSELADRINKAAEALESRLERINDDDPSPLHDDPSID